MSLMKIKDLFQFEKGSLQSMKASPGAYDFITASADWKTNNTFTHDCEALIFAAAASGSLGRTHYVNGKFISSDLCFIITPKDPDKYPIDLKFYHLIFLAFKDEIVRNTKSGTSKEAIGLTVFGKYELPYFDIDKQVETREKFVNAQESTNKLDSELTNQLDLLTQLRQAFLREAMQGKLVPQDPNDEPASVLLEKIKTEKECLVKEKKIKKPKPLPIITDEDIPYDIPDSWIWCRLGALCNIKSGKRIHAADYRKEGIQFLRSGEIGTLGRGELVNNPLYISEKKYNDIKTKFGIPKQGDILIACIGGSIGNTWVVDEREFYFKDGNLVLIESNDFINTGFLLYYLNSPFFWSNTILNATDSSYNALTIIKLNDAEFPLPSLLEQQRIASKVDELMAYCDELVASIKESQSQNELLLKQVLTEALGIKVQKTEQQEKTITEEHRTNKFDPNTTLMEIVELLKKHGKLHAEELWKMSKYPDDIDAFYAELKKQIELNKTVKESNEKGYLELV